MSLPIRQISINKVSSEIKLLNSKTTPSSDKIDGITLKNLPVKFIRFLTLIFNAILRVDRSGKCAKIIMILKPNKAENESYRPISLLSIFSKVSEQCHRIINEIFTAFEIKNYCTATFLNVQQAFDGLWHDVLLYKIKRLLPAPYFLFFMFLLYVQQKK